MKQYIKLHQKSILAIFGLAFLRLWPIFIGKTLYFGDNYSLMVPGKVFTANWIRQGLLPLWNPNILSGISWIGEINQSILYPFTLLFVVFEPAIALNLTFFFHLLLTMLGMYVLSFVVTKNKMAALLAAILWGFSTQITGSLNNLSTIQSLSWLPWVVWSGLFVTKHPRFRVVFGVLILLQFLFGVIVMGFQRQKNSVR
jgi:hypothetical protein